ncbi:MAG TPA: hypothetical protein VKR99_05730 [Candidatus Eremiobacteraceae bacterium]|nr:hypothetical protein [Candidatus Eremiobacteraceae bacterium]
MSGEKNTTAELTDPASGVVPMRDLAFSMLSVLVETAASQLHLHVPLQPDDDQREARPGVDLTEARAAIDAANALLGAVRQVMENDARLAIESMLTQLQIDYVRRTSRLK